MAKLRLDRFLSEQKTATRSQIKTILKKRNVCVNGVRTVDGSIKIEPDIDEITIDGERISNTRYVYIMLNKPCGVVTANKDNLDKTVLDLIGDEVLKKSELSAVGRLDKDTTGLLLLTNDGELNHRLLSPKHHVQKKYLTILDESIEDFDGVSARFKEGLDIGDPKITLPALLEKTNIQNGYFLTITEGRFHQVKRMFKAIGKNVVSLKRISMGSLSLDENLDEGNYRFLSKEEIDNLKKY